VAGPVAALRPAPEPAAPDTAAGADGAAGDATATAAAANGTVAPDGSGAGRAATRTAGGAAAEPAAPWMGSELRQPGAAILRMVAEGRTNVEIAGALHLSRQAVNYHVGRLMRALGAANRTALVALAYQRGLLQLTG
jgi:DNA-binding NarL/FixJ family response regulator